LKTKEKEGVLFPIIKDCSVKLLGWPIHFTGELVVKQSSQAWSTQITCFFWKKLVLHSKLIIYNNIFLEQKLLG
jgi:hypothetical protein